MTCKGCGHSNYCTCAEAAEWAKGEDAWLAAEVAVIDPFQDALPCWDENWQMPTAKEIRAERLTLDLELRKRIGRAQ